MDDSQPVEWSICVFAGPGALEGLTLEGEGLGVLEGPQARLQALLEGVFGERLPAQLRIWAEEIEAPSVLDSLAERWSGQRLRWWGGFELARAQDSNGHRELRKFLDWTRPSLDEAPHRRALVVLGDVLRAADYHGEQLRVSDMDRPGESGAKSVLIKGKEDEEDSASDEGTGTVDDLSSGTGSTSSRASAGSDRVLQPGAPKPAIHGRRAEPVSRAGRRMGVLVEALRSSHQHFELLVTDSVEATVLEELQRLAPYVDHVLAPQIQAPIAGGPLLALLHALAAQCRASQGVFEPAHLLREAVKGEDARSFRAALARAGQRAHEGADAPDERGEAASLAHVRRLRHAGHDLVALRCAGLEPLRAQVDALARGLAVVCGQQDFREQVELRRVLERSNAAYDDHSERSDLRAMVDALLDSEGALLARSRKQLRASGEAVREQLDSGELVLAQTHTPGMGREPLFGLSMHLPLRFDELGSEPAARVNPHLRPVLDALHYIDTQAGAIDEQARNRAQRYRRMHRDMAAFRDGSTAPVELPCVVTQTRLPWLALHYLPGDTPGGEGTVATMAQLARHCEVVMGAGIAALLDRPPRPKREQPRARTVFGSELERVAKGMLAVEDHGVDLVADELVRVRVPGETQGPDYGTSLIGDPRVVQVLSWREAGADKLLALDVSGAIWELPTGASALSEGTLRERVVDEGNFVIRAEVDQQRPGAGFLLVVGIARPELAARLSTTLAKGDWYGFRCVEALGAKNSGDAALLREFVEQALDEQPARHSSLVIGGRAQADGSFSLCHDASETSFMTLTALAEALRDALDASGRERLSLLIVEDPSLMSLEVLYELRELAHVLIAPAPGGSLDGVELLRSLEPLLNDAPWGIEARALRRIEAQLVDLGLDLDFHQRRGWWEREVARLAAEELLDLSRYPALGERVEFYIEDQAKQAALQHNLGLDHEPGVIRAVQQVVGAPATGVFELDTVEALFVWQGRFGLPQHGRLDEPSYARIAELLGMMDTEQERGQPKPKPEPKLSEDERRALEAKLEQKGPPGEQLTQLPQAQLVQDFGPKQRVKLELAQMLAREDPKRVVEELQKVLRVRVDGVFGNITASAMQQWQQRVGLHRGHAPESHASAPGELRDRQLAALAESYFRPPDRPTLPPTRRPDEPDYGQLEADAELVRYVQWVIGVPVDGRFGDMSAHALGVWQRAMDLHPSERLDAFTLPMLMWIGVAAEHNAGVSLTAEQRRALVLVLGLPEDFDATNEWPATTQALYLWQGQVGAAPSARLDRPSLALLEAHAHTSPRLQAVDLHAVDRLGRRVDAVCRAALRELGEGKVWESLRFTERRADERRVLRSLIVDIQGSEEAANLNEILDPYWAGTRTHGARALWIGKPPVRAFGRLMVSTAAEPAPSYLELEIHQHVRLNALFSAYRLLTNLAGQTHRLWGLVSAGIAFMPPHIRNMQLSRLLGRPVDSRMVERQFVTLAVAPLITMALEPSRKDRSSYELRLTSSESTALLLRQTSQVNAQAIDEALAGLDFLLAGRQATATAWRYLQALGASLGEDIINHLHERLELERRHVLTNSGQDAHLVLAIPRELMRYPWELMFVPTGAQGREMLCERYALGRQVWSEGQRRALNRLGRDRKLKALIIGDVQDSGVPLPGARAEAEELAALFEEMASELGEEMDFERTRDVYIGTTLTREALRRLLREGNYDIVHFAGHGSYSSEHPERSAWLLSDGPLWAAELSKTLAWSPSPPWLIFANACHAAMTSDRETRAYQGDVFGLAEACIGEGVAAYIAPLWEVSDEPARILATTLYRELVLRRASIGAALRRARQTTRKRCEAQAVGAKVDISWASMVLYGNPTDQLFSALGAELPAV